jgi:hypothetical protein
MFVLNYGPKASRGKLEDLDGDGRIILKWIFKKWDVSLWTEFICFGIISVSTFL